MPGRDALHCFMEKQVRFTIDAYKRIAELEAKLA